MVRSTSGVQRPSRCFPCSAFVFLWPFFPVSTENYAKITGFPYIKFPIFQKMELEANDTHTTPTPRQDPQRERAARSDTHESPFPRDRALSRTSPGGSASARRSHNHRGIPDLYYRLVHTATLRKKPTSSSLPSCYCFFF